MSVITEPLWSRIVRLLRWHKPAGRLILMIPALWALVLSCHQQAQYPPVDLTIVIILGSLATSAMGCVINDLWDRDLDGQVDRTRTRPFAEKSLSLWIGGIVLLIASFCGLGLAAYLNTLSFLLCCIAFPIIAVYPACKRFFPVPQLVLSIAWGFAVLIPWSAVTGNLDNHAWALWGATLSWTMGFDTIYALSDRENDQKIGIQSSAIFFGTYVTQAIGVFFATTVGILGYLAWDMHLGYISVLALATGAGIWIGQWWRLRQQEMLPEIAPEIYARMFGENVQIGFVLLFGMIFS